VKRLLLFVLVVAATGCAGDGETVTTTVTETETTTVTETEPETLAVRVYFFREGKVWPAAREVPETGGVAVGAFGALFEGPTEMEIADLQFRTYLPELPTSAAVAVADGVARLDMGGAELPRRALAQVVYTLTQDPTVKSVEFEGRTLTRANFEDLTPAILVESPLPFEEVGSPLRVAGTANTFEADFEYELTDTDGRIVDMNFVKATSGTGTRGTFDFTTAAYTVPFDGIGSLIVFESSAKDGSRINLVEIPLRMKR
jgi:germination protein M